MKIVSKSELKKLLKEKKLPSHDFLFELSESVSTILEEEITDYRQAALNGEPGSLLDFQSDSQPIIVVPDLHGRTEFLSNIISYKLPKDFIGKSITIFKALEEKLIKLVFVGDILHTERNTKLRWLLAQEDFENEIYSGQAMVQEMEESLALWCALFQLKINFPESCHILKGNHENILNAFTDGDFGFRKYANEGAMVKAFVQDYYGDDILYLIHCVEKALPLAVVGNNCVISHAEPKYCYTKEEIINARQAAEVIAGLTWTDNGEAEDGSVEAVIKNLSNNENIDDYMYLGGHRCVKSLYKLRQNGRYVQIHNPSKQNIALVYKDRKFNPEKDIVGVQK